MSRSPKRRNPKNNPNCFPIPPSLKGEYNIGQLNRITPYHAKLFAYELTKRSSSDNLGKIASALVDAQVDLNPHQVDAALFAFQSPLSKGAILADEVGLGKTIEAGLVISQKWAERKRKILIIVPSSLRKQWNQELQDKFFIPSTILEAKSFNTVIKSGNLNPFSVKDEVVITSYHFARNKSAYIKSINWDLAVIDEAHRLRNVYKSSNKIAKEIKNALSHCPKILLTATPLQNSLLELYGLVSIIDEHVFGDLNSFKSQFARLDDGTYQFDDLKERLRTICKRTLRRQVLEYVKYTNRIAITQEYTPRNDEQELYEEVSAYLQRESLYALPESQRKLMTLMLRKLLSSSSFAIQATLEKLVIRLQSIVEEYERSKSSEMTEVDLSENIESFGEYSDEWVDEEETETEESDSTEKKIKVFTEQDIVNIRLEIEDLEELVIKAKKIIANSKGENLVQALRRGIEKTKEKGGLEKAIIFTESTRTQKYILDVLSATEYQGKIVLFNGTNTDEKSKEIYRDWLEVNKNTDKVTGSKTADLRAALVEYFRDQAVIMIATEAAAEGVNLQFCSLVVNYDLPWNPQRIEQRIGRCHRYGQKNDVVVVNFINIKNEADKRVYEILDKKFKLFNGVFGASDEVLGSIESGIDFEKRILNIYQQARTPQQIQLSFDDLQVELEDKITETLQSTRKKLLENFDEEVHQKLRVRMQQSQEYQNKYEEWLWNVTRFFLKDFADFNNSGEFSFTLHKNPFPGEVIPAGPYRLGRNIEDAHIYRIGHPMAMRVINNVKSTETSDREVIFDFTNSSKKISILEKFVGHSGYLIVKVLTVSALEEEDHIILAGIDDYGVVIDNDQLLRLFSLEGEVKDSILLDSGMQQSLDSFIALQKSTILNTVDQRNSNLFNLEIEKLDKWADDNKVNLKTKMNELENQIKAKKKESLFATNLPDKLKIRKELHSVLEKKHDYYWKEYEEKAREIEKRKDSLIDELEGKLNQSVTEEKLFAIRWSII